jgi:E3 ubiquitin-protein ligase RAD18
MDLYRWVVLYNANLDRSPNNRKTTVELKKDLKKWEEERPKKKKLVVSDVLGYQVHKSHLFCYLRLLTNGFIVSDNSQD